MKETTEERQNLDHCPNCGAKGKLNALTANIDYECGTRWEQPGFWSLSAWCIEKVKKRTEGTEGTKKTITPEELQKEANRDVHPESCPWCQWRRWAKAGKGMQVQYTCGSGVNDLGHWYRTGKCMDKEAQQQKEWRANKKVIVVDYPGQEESPKVKELEEKLAVLRSNYDQARAEATKWHRRTLDLLEQREQQQAQLEHITKLKDEFAQALEGLMKRVMEMGNRRAA